MTKINDGGPAFPRTGQTDGITTTEQDGMSRRDWLAGLAMQGEVAGFPDDESWDAPDLAQWAYRVADAMIAEGDKGSVAV